jgi:hypothetical protein
VQGTVVRLYRNGDEVGLLGYDGTLAQEGSQWLGIGARPDGVGGLEGYGWNGKVDEVRISAVGRSADWMRASWQNGAQAGFLSYTLDTQWTGGLWDSDGDGLPDGWEREHYGSVSGGDGQGDRDGDGARDGEEYVAGTDPEDGADVFSLELQRGPGVQVCLRTRAAEGAGYGGLERVYRLQTPGTDLIRGQWCGVPGWRWVLGDGELKAYAVPAGQQAGLYRGTAWLQAAGTLAAQTVDGDGDGVADAWSEAFQVGPAGEDADGDGASNGEEYIAGTDPTDPGDKPGLRLQSGAAGVQVRLDTLQTGGVGTMGLERWYRLEERADLLSGRWQAVPGWERVYGDGNAKLYTPPAACAQHYYRLIITLE